MANLYLIWDIIKKYPAVVMGGVYITFCHMAYFYCLGSRWALNCDLTEYFKTFAGVFLSANFLFVLIVAPILAPKLLSYQAFYKRIMNDGNNKNNLFILVCIMVIIFFSSIWALYDTSINIGIPLYFIGIPVYVVFFIANILVRKSEEERFFVNVLCIIFWAFYTGYSSLIYDTSHSKLDVVDDKGGNKYTWVRNVEESYLVKENDLYMVIKAEPKLRLQEKKAILVPRA